MLEICAGPGSELKYHYLPSNFYEQLATTT